MSKHESTATAGDKTLYLWEYCNGTKPNIFVVGTQEDGEAISGAVQVADTALIVQTPRAKRSAESLLAFLQAKGAVNATMTEKRLCYNVRAPASDWVKLGAGFELSERTQDRIYRVAATGGRKKVQEVESPSGAAIEESNQACTAALAALAAQVQELQAQLAQALGTLKAQESRIAAIELRL